MDTSKYDVKASTTEYEISSNGVKTSTLEYTEESKRFLNFKQFPDLIDDLQALGSKYDLKTLNITFEKEVKEADELYKIEHEITYDFSKRKIAYDIEVL